MSLNLQLLFLTGQYSMAWLIPKPSELITKVGKPGLQDSFVSPSSHLIQTMNGESVKTTVF